MAIRERIRKTFIDTTDLDLANQEIGYLKDLYDKDQQIIAYQKELLNIQGENLKDLRFQLTEFENIKREVEELKNARKTTRGKHNTRNKSRN